MLAHADIADSHLAQLAVHIGHEQFGQPHAFLPGLIAPLESQQHDRQQRGDHVEPAIHRVGDRAVFVPVGLACAGHHLLIERQQRRGIVCLAPEYPPDQSHYRP